MKTIPMRDFSQRDVSDMLSAAERGPVLVTENNEPAVWMISARELAEVASQLAAGTVYRDALASIAVHLYADGVLSLG